MSLSRHEDELSAGRPSNNISAGDGGTRCWKWCRMNCAEESPTSDSWQHRMQHSHLCMSNNSRASRTKRRFSRQQSASSSLAALLTGLNLWGCGLLASSKGTCRRTAIGRSWKTSRAVRAWSGYRFCSTLTFYRATTATHGRTLTLGGHQAQKSRH